MRLLRTFFILTIILCPVFIHAADISDDLQAQMQVSKTDQLISVWIELPKVVNGKQIAAAHSSAMQTRAERYKVVLTNLKESHANAQRSVLGYLRSLPNFQDKNIKPHWMINLVEADLTSQEIIKLANRTDIEKIYIAPQLVTIEPKIVQKSSMSLSAGVESNLTYIRADSAWKMGYTGAGSVVCSFDTGVDGEHPALKHSWRGLDGDSLASWFDPAKNQLAPHSVPDCGLTGCNTNHGTHTMGIMVGVDTLSGDTVGVAPGAKWISAAVIDIAGTSIVDAFEWAADPDGDPNTMDDIPDVINHSWGIPGLECENLFYDLIDNTEALGIVNIFAAGNEGGFGASTIRNPANRANDSLDCFAIGNIDHLTEAVSGSSSRGPSICPVGAIKPNVVAPGTAIRSTYPNGLYGSMSGTSMAAPHVSGLVALLRQKNPNATVDEIKTAILTSTQNIGQVVPNNDIGWGVIDCVTALNNLSSVNSTPNISLYSFDHPSISAGDTVVGTIVLQNRGASVSSVTASIIGVNPALEVLAGSASFGTIAEGDTVRAGSSFEAVVADTASVGSFLPIDLEVSGAGYTDTLKLYYVVEPKTSRSFVTHNVGNIQFSLSNFGTFGLGAGSFFPIGGSGFRYNGGGDDLFEGGLMIGQNLTNVSDGVRNLGGEPDGDFQVMPGGDITFVTPKIGVTQESFARFSDSRAENPIGLEIEQNSYAFSNVLYQDFIILQFVITNRSGGSLSNLYVGLYMDWDVPTYNSNAGGYELTDDFSWVAYNSSGVLSNYRGVKVLHPATDGSFTELADSAAFPSSLADAAHDGLTELEKIRALSNGFAGSETFKSLRKDLFQVTSAKISLADNQIDTVTFALLAGDTYSDIQNAALEASNVYLGLIDFDNDGISDSIDNCPFTYNPTQEDTDGDGVGDSCDVCIGFDDLADVDNDGVPDSCDICPGFDDLADADNDGVPDSCDICPGFDDLADADNDGVPDSCDICPGFDDLADADNDGVPDSCDIELPQSFSLSQNYPNPFNPTTSILFELPKRTEYKFEIFNLVGQKIYEKNETADAGQYSIVWDASEFASGVYLYKLTSDSYSESKKMLLLK